MGDPSQYPWSSYLVYVGKRKGWNWLQTVFILDQLSLEEGEARKKYHRYIEEAIGRPPKDPLEKVVASTLLGSEKFVDQVRSRWLKKAMAHRDIPALRKLSFWPDLSSIVRESGEEFGRGAAESRRVALYLSHRLSGFPLEEIGKYFGGISSSGVSQNTRRFEEQMKGDRKLFEKVNQLKKRLSQ